MFPESLEKAYHKSTIHEKVIMNFFYVSLWCQMDLLQNVTLSSASRTQGLFLFHTSSSYGLQGNVNYP